MPLRDDVMTYNFVFVKHIIDIQYTKRNISNINTHFLKSDIFIFKNKFFFNNDILCILCIYSY